MMSRKRKLCSSREGALVHEVRESAAGWIRMSSIESWSARPD